MSADFSIGQVLARLNPGRPLIIADADEVILRFVEGFDQFLKEQGLYLDLTSYRLHGNVKRLADQIAVLDVEVTALLDEFRQDLDSLQAVDGACSALTRLSTAADIVVLSNITECQAPARRRNLQSLSLDFPIIANSGPKGAAVKALAAHTTAATFFIDDLPQHLASVAELAPKIFTIHLVGDSRLKGLLPVPIHANCHADDWAAAEAFIAARLT
ncbi:MAG: hypothetical protein KGI68_08845 [Alphaproteobacteria bacterium]|nr:hypothetical protein [Alphaproteobacteria bacterium]MDE2265382.1 hypothetical protein [Alphaproteobacteria bacterium]MDE2500660.1 hypothetical protein [Alphaproteobacteria bacterium]